jgi:hypothetical protein
MGALHRCTATAATALTLRYARAPSPATGPAPPRPAAIGPASVNQGIKAIIIARGNVLEDGFDFTSAWPAARGLTRCASAPVPASATPA